MKKIVVTFLLAVLPLVSFGQSFFEQYEDEDGVTSFFATKETFKLLKSIDADPQDQETKEFFKMIESLEAVKMISTDRKDLGAKFKGLAENHVSKNGLTELMRVNDDGKKVKFYVKKGKSDSIVKELFMLVTGVEMDGNKASTIVMSVTGDINLKHISKLTSKMNIPGGEHLEKKGKE
ncbi:MAG: DUF4252 domain-containing protein [Flavobacteriaceae bacterium]|nr:DUF4252 domain-containing protein [Flavobacteriaceae bacterium]